LNILARSVRWGKKKSKTIKFTRIKQRSVRKAVRGFGGGGMKAFKEVLWGKTGPLKKNFKPGQEENFRKDIRAHKGPII